MSEQRLIDANALKEELIKQFWHGDLEETQEAFNQGIEKAIKIIDNATTVETDNERLINEYISKVGCCDECFASIYCTVNGLRKSRVPQDYCVKNIKSYFDDKVYWQDSNDQKGGAEEND